MKLRMPPQSRVLTPRILLGTIISATIVLTASADLTNCTPPPSGLVGWWPGEGNANDRVGTNNGTLRGGATFASGEVGQAFSFDGVTGSVMVPDAPALHFTNAMTVEAWVNPKAIGGHFQEVVSKWFGSDNQLSFTTSITPQGQAYLLVSSDGQTSVLGGDYMLVYTTNSIPANHWTHFAATYDGAWLKAYLNGAFENQVPWTNGIFPGTGPLFIGEDYSESLFNGLIDEVSLYNRALSDSEITAIYSAGSAGKCPPATPSILTQPASQTVLAGSTATFTVTAAGTAPLSYQWQFNRTNIDGATGTSLVLSNVQPANSGSYAILVTNAYGSIISSNALLTVTSPPTCLPAPRGLVAWWRGEGDALDAFDGNNGTLQGGATFAAGKVGQAFSFNGVDGSVVVPDAPALRMTNALTVEAWIYPKSSGTAQGILLKWFGNGNQLAYSTAIHSTGQAYLLVSQNGLGNIADVDYKVVFSTNTVPLNQWTHYAGVYDGTWLKVYLNGVLNNQALWTNGIFPGTAPIVIGEALYQSPFNGLIDEPSIYNRALTDAEILQIYNAGSLGKCFTVAPAVVASPASQMVIAGSDVTFTVSAGGTPPLSYQWVFDGTNIVGRTAFNLSITNVQLTDAGSYSVVVTNAYGAVTSSIAVLTVNLPPPCTPAPSGLVAWWRCEGNGQDSFGSNNGTLQGGVTFAAGEVGRSFSFNGVSGSVLVPDAPALRVTNALTIEAWIYPKSSGTAQGILLKWFGNGNQLSYSTAIHSTGQAYLLVSKNGLGNTADVDYKVVFSTNTVPLNQWTHFAGVYDGAWLKVYLNGVLESQVPWTNGIFPGTAPLYIGEATYQSPFNGLIDEPSVYNRALTDVEVRQIFSAGSAGKCPLAAPSITAQPASETVIAGATATFTVTAAGTPPLSYQWRFGGSNIAGATGTSLTLNNVQPAQAGIYTVQVTNVYGSTNSANTILTVNPLPCAPPPSGLVSWWRGEGDCLDAVGTNNGTLENGAGFAAGRVGQAFSFDGINDFVKVPKSASLDAPSQLTIDFWMNVDPSQPIGSRVVGLVTSDFYGFEIGTAAAKLGIGFWISTENGVHYAQTLDANSMGAVFPAGGWHHIAGVYDGTKIQLYLDGSALGNPMAVTGQISPMLANSFVAIGSSDGRTTCSECFGTRYFKGMIDEVDFFNRALSANEIAAIYDAGAFGKCVPPIPPYISVQPSNRTVATGANVTFSAVVAGTSPLSYQWRFNGTNFTGATASALTLTDVQVGQSGSYTLVVTNAYGTVTSSDAVLTVNPPPPCAPAPSNLVSWWRGEGDGLDAVGTNNGVLQNGAGFAAGRVGQAFSFDGINDFVKVPKSASLDAPSQLTIDFWMNVDPSQPIGSRVVGLVTSDFYGFEIGTAAAKLGIGFWISTENGVHYAQTLDANSMGAVFPAGEWHHIAGVYDGTKIQLYVDGSALGNPMAVTGQISPMLANSFVAIGSSDGRTACAQCFGSRYFKGMIDEVDFFNRALSPSEIAAIYSAGAAGKCPPGLAPSITAQPASQTVLAGAAASFTVTAMGTPPLSYQWDFNGTNIAGATGNSLTLSNVQPAQAGIYAVQVTNAYGSTDSANALLTVNASPACTPTLLGLVSWWPGGGNGNDIAGANNGTLSGGTSFAIGEVGQAFSFDGANGTVIVADSSSLRLTNQLTIEAWINVATTNTEHAIVSKVGGTGGNNGYQLGLHGNTLWAAFNSPGGNWPQFEVTSASLITSGAWNHVAWTYDQSAMKLYLNGAPVATNVIGPHPINTSSSNLRISGDDSLHVYFDGLIDEASVYNRALTASEIQAIYNAGSAGKCSAGTAPSITAQPASQTVIAGSSATFTVTAAGTPPLSYQWRFGGTNIAGATGISLTLSNVQPAQAGIYAVQVTNAYGSTDSANAILTVNPLSCAPPPSGLVSWWRGEGDCLDAVGSNNGTLQNGATFAAGRVGQSFRFDGVDDYVKIPKSASLDAPNQLTIDFWMNVDPSQPIGSQVVGLVTSDFYAFEIGTSASKVGVVFGVSTDNGGHYVLTFDLNSSGAVFPAGEWHHIAGVYDGAKVQLYLDGQASGNPAPVTGQISPMLANSFVAIGSSDGRTACGQCSGSRYFKGMIDEVDFFNRALSPGEIAAIYGAGAAGKCPSGTAPSITAEPASQTVVAGASATFSVTAAGTPPLSFQWQFNGTNISGATDALLALPNVQIAQAGTYSVQVTNAFGFTNSIGAILTVNPPPGCMAAPSGLVSWWRAEGNAWDQLGGNNGMLQNGTTFAAGRVGQAFSFTGTGAYVKVPKSPGLDVGNQLTIDFWMKADPSSPITTCCQGLVTSDFYAVEVGGGGAQTVGILAGISVDGGATTPTTGDANGGGAAISSGEWHHVAATYNGTQLQLYIDGQPSGNPMPVSGPISPMLANSFVAIGSEDGRTKFPSVIGTRYFAGEMDEVDIFNRALSATEIAAIYAAGVSGKCLTASAPYIYAQPANQVVTVGGSVTFSIAVGGTPPLSYQWSFGGSALDGATNASLTLTNVQFSQAGSYSVVITNVAGRASSSNATLSVNFPPASVRVVNVTNAQSGATVNVPVSLTANGNENGLSFSLNFDTTKLTYVGIALGSGASGANLLTNAAQAASGKLGVILTLQPNQTFAAGAQELVQVTFMAAVRTTAFSTTVSFGDVPIVRELSDAPGNVLAATYASGVVWIQAANFEGDLAPRPNGDKAVTVTDWVLGGRYAARLDYPTNAAEFQRADCAPRATLGDGAITVIDWVQVGLYAAHLDPLTVAGGPTNETHPGGLVSGADSTPRTPRGGPPSSRLLEVADTMVIQGLTGTASVQLESQGDENAVGFSLLFDPAAMNYVSASLGSASNGVTLFVNDSQAGAGRLGFVLGLGTRRSFVSGTRELVKVTFRAAAAAKGNCTVSFANQPVPCEVSGTNALPLAAGYVNGTITVNPLPSLSIGRSGADITLAWPLWATNFGLQAAEGGLLPTVPWTNLVTVPTLTSNQAIVTMPLAATNKVYRLRQP